MPCSVNKLHSSSAKDGRSKGKLRTVLCLFNWCQVHRALLGRTQFQEQASAFVLICVRYLSRTVRSLPRELAIV